MGEQNPVAYTPERAAETERAVLAPFAGAVAEDYKIVDAIWRDTNPVGVLTAAMGFMAEILRGHGTDQSSGLLRSRCRGTATWQSAGGVIAINGGS